MSSFSTLHWIIFGAIVWGIFSFLRGVAEGKGKVNAQGSMICPHCGTRGEPAQATKGSMGIEIVLWLAFIIPGLIYSLWRLSSRHAVCPTCRQPGMIPAVSPAGQSLADKYRNQHHQTSPE